MNVSIELTQTLQIGLLNGWLLIALLYLVYGVLLYFFPKDVVARLYDKSGRAKRQRIIIYTGGLLAAAIFALSILTPLQIGSNYFIPGMMLYGLGLSGFVVALFNFKNTPHNQPVTEGLYRISRNPQQVMFFFTFMGVCIAMGSWLALLIQMVSSVLLHTRILAEENTCLERYGESYREYVKSVPRYFLFF
jgi:protein-S-isoprenylcysteine O-methyltransferase Ste14